MLDFYELTSDTDHSISSLNSDFEDTQSTDSEDEDISRVGPQDEQTLEALLYDVNIDDEEILNGDETEELKPLLDPTKDIQWDFARIISEEFSFDGAFMASERYSMEDASNPCLNIDGLGPIGLPLSAREAIAVRALAVPVPMAPHTWEIPLKKCKFDNHSWEPWIQGTVGSKIMNLLAGENDTQPILRPHRLCLYEAESPHTHFKETDDSEDKIGCLFVILPSLFEGGQLELRHDGEIKILNLAHLSGVSTFVAGTFTGVEHSMSPVSSGYRLWLEYDLIQPMTHLDEKPCLPDMQGPTRALRHLMVSWKQKKNPHQPPFLAVLLKHKYPRTPNFGAKTLEGSDALLVSRLRNLARGLKFRLYLVHVEQKYCWKGELKYRYRAGDYYYESDGWGSSEDEEDETEDEHEDDTKLRKNKYDKFGDTARPLRVVEIMKLDGMPVNVEKLILQDDDLLNGSMTDYDPDQVHVKKKRVTAKEIRCYKRTVLLVWPKCPREFAVKVGNVFDHVCNALGNSLSISPTATERRLVENLIQCCKENRKNKTQLRRSIQVVRESADRWNDIEILLGALKACRVDRNTSLLGIDGFVSMYQAFGWNAVESFFNDAVMNDLSHSRRQTLLRGLTQAAQEHGDTVMEMWCAERNDKILRSLSKPVQITEIDWIFEQSIARGSEFLRDIIFPQLEEQGLKKELWIAVVRYLQQDKRIPTDMRKILLSRALTDAVRALPAFPTYRTESWTSTDREPDAESIMEMIQLCISSNHEELCVEIFGKMSAASRDDVYMQRIPPSWLYYGELIVFVEAVLSSDSNRTLKSPQIFHDFFRDATLAFLRSPLTHICLNGVDLEELVAIGINGSGGDLGFLRQRLDLNHRLKLWTPDALHKLCCSISAGLKPPREAAPLQDHMAVVFDIGDAAIESFSADPVQTPDPVGRAMDLLRFLFTANAHVEYERFLGSLLVPPGISVRRYLVDFHVPFLKAFRLFLDTDYPTLGSAPIDIFFADVVKAFANNVMDEKPPEVQVTADELQDMGCGDDSCEACQELQGFFFSDKESIAFTRVAAIRAHLGQQLEGTDEWGVVCETLKAGRTHTLKVTKPAAVTELGLWSANNQMGNELLVLLGDEESQRRILATGFEHVVAKITGTAAESTETPEHAAGHKRPNSDLEGPDDGLATGPSSKRPRLP